MRMLIHVVGVSPVAMQDFLSRIPVATLVEEETSQVQWITFCRHLDSEPTHTKTK